MTAGGGELRRAGVALAATNLSKRYGAKVVALDRVTIGVPAGSITALVGPNGAGKSTLLRTWMGFERPSSGSVSVLGEDPVRRPERALQGVAYLAQTPALYAELSVRDHLTLVEHFKQARFSRATAERRLDDLGIDVGANAGSLSGGQAAQLGLALAIGMRAEVIVLDEPLAHLDPLARRTFIDVLSDHAHESAATVVMSSHIVSDMERACDRLLLLDRGRVILDSSIAELIAEPAPPDGGAARSAAPGSLEDVLIRHLARAT